MNAFFKIIFVYFYQAAKQLIEEKTKEQHNNAARANEQAQTVPPSSPQVNTVQSVQW